MRDDKTARGYPLPHIDNALEDDLSRLREAFGDIDADVSGIETELAAKADTSAVNTALAAVQSAAADALAGTKAELEESIAAAIGGIEAVLDAVNGEAEESP